MFSDSQTVDDIAVSCRQNYFLFLFFLFFSVLKYCCLLGVMLNLCVNGPFTIMFSTCNLFLLPTRLLLPLQLQLSLRDFLLWLPREWFNWPLVKQTNDLVLYHIDASLFRFGNCGRLLEMGLIVDMDWLLMLFLDHDFSNFNEGVWLLGRNEWLGWMLLYGLCLQLRP